LFAGSHLHTAQKLTRDSYVITSDARLFCKNKQVNLKNKPKIGSLTEKQALYALAGKFNKTKSQEENYIKNREADRKKQAQN